MSAYRQAEKDPVAKGNSDLNFNKGIALLYEEDYPAALASFDRASALEPEWEKPQLYKRNLIKKLQQTQSLIEMKGKLKTKRFNALVDSLNNSSSNHLGPYGGGKFSSSRGVSVALSEIKAFGDLAEGINEEKVAVGKVTCSVHSDEAVPL